MEGERAFLIYPSWELMWPSHKEVNAGTSQEKCIHVHFCLEEFSKTCSPPQSEGEWIERKMQRWLLFLLTAFFAQIFAGQLHRLAPLILAVEGSLIQDTNPVSLRNLISFLNHDFLTIPGGKGHGFPLNCQVYL